MNEDHKPDSPSQSVSNDSVKPTCVIFDLDGTLIDTETIVLGVSQSILNKYDKVLTKDAIAASIGKRPLDAWQQVIDILNIPATAEELFHETESVLTERWHEAPYLPGALRLVKHLKESGHVIALATSTSRQVLARKLRNKEPLQNAFDVVICGDDPDLKQGKPAPDCFLKVAKLLKVSPAECLVIEDSRSGVQAALAADMHVVYVPSLRGMCGIPDDAVGSSGDKTAMYNLTPFPEGSRIHGTVPLEHVWRVQGRVVVGFGRGSKQLGIPTANVDPEAVSKVIAGSSSGVFFGWALIEDFGDGQVYPCCSSIGWNPVFKNANKTCEPWILHDFGGECFVGKIIRLIICGYIRPESNFPSLDALIERIRVDAEVTKQALSHPKYSRFRTDPFLLTSPGNEAGSIPVSQTK
eukprot:jgi/Picsp_1/3806/NSC_01318-R1_riboflavin kinase